MHTRQLPLQKGGRILSGSRTDFPASPDFYQLLGLTRDATASRIEQIIEKYEDRFESEGWAYMGVYYSKEEFMAKVRYFTEHLHERPSFPRL